MRSTTWKDGAVLEHAPFGLDRGLGGVADLARQVEVELVAELEHGSRVAGLAGGLLDRGGRDALEQHPDALVDEGPDHAAGEEAAAVVDDDRRLLDLLGEVERPVEGLVVGLLALDDLQQRHLVDRAEEVQADEVRRAGDALGELGDRQRRGVRAQQRVGREMRLDLREHLGLDGRVLEHGLDHEVGARRPPPGRSVGVIRASSSSAFSWVERPRETAFSSRPAE